MIFEIFSVKLLQVLHDKWVMLVHNELQVILQILIWIKVVLTRPFQDI